MRTLLLHLQRLALVAVLFAIGHAVNAQDTPATKPLAAPDAALTEPSYDPLAVPATPEERPAPHKAPAVARRPIADMVVAPAPEAPAPALDPLTPPAAVPANVPVALEDDIAPVEAPAERVEPVSPVTP